MRLIRNGSQRYHGSASADLPLSEFDVSRLGFTGMARHVRDFSTEASHDYVVDVSFQEFALLVRAAAEALASNDKGMVVAAVRPLLRELLELALASASDDGGP